MKKIAFTALFLILAALPAFSQTRMQERRIEEDKRVILESTESVPVSEEKLLEPPIKPPPDSRMDYFEKLAAKSAVDLDDCCRVLVMLLGRDADLDDFESRSSFLSKEKILPARMRKDPDPGIRVRRGDAALMFCSALRIRGGVLLMFFPESQRYAIKELAYEGIMYPSDSNGLLRGNELVIMLTGAAEYLAARYEDK